MSVGVATVPVTRFGMAAGALAGVGLTFLSVVGVRVAAVPVNVSPPFLLRVLHNIKQCLEMQA